MADDSKGEGDTAISLCCLCFSRSLFRRKGIRGEISGVVEWK